MGIHGVRWPVGLLNKVCSCFALLLLAGLWPHVGEAARPSTFDLAHVQLSDAEPGYFAEVLDSAIGMVKAVGTAIRRGHNAEEIHIDVHEAVAATTSTTLIGSRQTEPDAAELCKLGEESGGPSIMVRALQACIQSLENLAKKTKEHTGKSKDDNIDYTSAYRKADDMLKGMEDRKRAQHAFASDQNLAYCVLNLRLCRIQNDFASLDSRGGTKACDTVEQCASELNKAMNLDLSLTRLNNATMSTTPSSEINGSNSTSTAAFNTTSTEAATTTTTTTRRTTTTTVRTTTTVTSTTRISAVKIPSSKSNKSTVSKGGNHLLDEVDKGLRERGISIRHETFRVTLMWDDAVDIDLQLLVAHDEGDKVVKNSVYWGRKAFGPFKLDVDDRALTSYSKHIESIGVETDHARLPDGDYLIVGNYFAGTPLLGSDKKPIRSVDCGSDGKPHLCIDKSFVPQVVYHAVLSFRSPRDGSYIIMPRNSAACPPGREIKDPGECLRAINGLMHRQWKQTTGMTSPGPRYCSVHYGGHGAMKPTYAPELEHVRGSKAAGPVCKSSDVGQALVSQGTLTSIGETQVLFHFRVKDNKIVTLLTAPCGFSGIDCRDTPPIATPVLNGTKESTG